MKFGMEMEKINKFNSNPGGLIEKFIFGLLAIIILLDPAYSQLSVHGYLNQAYAISDGNQIFGITGEGTSDYRNLALQFRYDIQDQSNFVIQFSHKRVGKNPLMETEPDVKLDWAYFQYQFNDQFYARVGKIQFPLGNYNEYREVGILLPFYSVPFSPYGEGNYMSETLDGLLFLYRIELTPAWAFDFNVYAGNWIWQEWIRYNYPGFGLVNEIGSIRVNTGFGGQIHVETPIVGAEFKIGGQYGEPEGGLSFKKGGYFGKPMKFYDYFFAFKYESKYFFYGLDAADVKFFDIQMSVLMFNNQAGFHVYNELDLNVQYEFIKMYDVFIPVDLVNLLGKLNKTIDYNEDFAIGLKYKLSSNLVFKIETHWNKGYFAEDIAINHLIDEPVKTQYMILSVATSF